MGKMGLHEDKTLEISDELDDSISNVNSKETFLNLNHKNRPLAHLTKNL